MVIDDGMTGVDGYREALAEYCKTHSEDSLYRASLLSASLIEDQLGPDDIVALHFDSVQSIAANESLPHNDRIRILNDAHQFLLEVMISYGAQYKEFLDLRLSDALHRAEQAELGQRERMEILGVIAHELGNPLTVALGNMQMVVRLLDASDIKTVRELVTESRIALERLAAVTGQLVSASSGDDLVIVQEPMELRRVVKRMLAWVIRLAEEKKVSVEFDANGEYVWVTGDQEALTSVASNLISNAVRYTPAGGKVTISLKKDGDLAVLEVTDTGVGMSDDEMGRIFEKFFRSETAKTLEPGGMGMGLDIAQRLVKAHNGRIEVESTLGSGSSFRVLIPAMEVDANDHS